MLLEIKISDTGIGISPEDQAVIFNAFQQVQGQTNRKYGGTGLGLTITRRLTEMMGGTITVTSQVNQGSTFTLYFPAIKVLPDQSVNGLKAQLDKHIKLQELPPLTILVVDDVASNRELIKAYFTDTHHHILMAESGSLGLTLAQTKNPDVILLDAVMPSPDGKEVLKILKQDERTCHIPVIMVTASIQEQEIAELMFLAQGFLRKPLSMQQLAQELLWIFSPESLTSSVEDESVNIETGISDSGVIIAAKSSSELLELLDLLQQEEEQVWQSLHRSLVMDKLRVFANKLETWADQYQCSELQAYVTRLQYQIKHLDLLHLADTVADFPKIKVQLQQKIASL